VEARDRLLPRLMLLVVVVVVVVMSVWCFIGSGRREISL
jgi:hypothetical protein